MIAARIAENSRQRSEVQANTDKAQMLDDEMFALYLQNEEFLNDLREDEDFMRTLERGKREGKCERGERNFTSKGSSIDMCLFLTGEGDRVSAF